MSLSGYNLHPNISNQGAIKKQEVSTQDFCTAQALSLPFFKIHSNFFSTNPHVQYLSSCGLNPFESKLIVPVSSLKFEYGEFEPLLIPICVMCTRLYVPDLNWWELVVYFVGLGSRPFEMWT